MSRTKRIIAAFFALLMLSESILPTAAYALSSGPSQPEVQGFQPAGVNDMVNLFTGDFSYNIPLLDVEGYPVNLFYNAGIGMDQEASWVGLGWNLNPGVVERNLRGLPDDFNGDGIERTMGLRPNRTFGLSYGSGLELFGTKKWNLNTGISPSFNNYDGPEFTMSLGPSMKSTLGASSSMTMGIGLTSSSSSGLTVRPTIGFDRSNIEALNKCTAGLNFGISINSRQGMTDMSVGATLRHTQEYKVKPADEKGNEGKENRYRGIGGGGAASTSFNMGGPTYTPQVMLPMENRSASFHYSGISSVAGTHPNFSLGGFFSSQRLSTDRMVRPAYGYLHLGAGQGNLNGMLDFNREKDGPYSDDRASLGIASLTNDIFSVSGQGVSGSYRAFRSEVGHVYDPVTSCTGSGAEASIEVGAGQGFHAGGSVKLNEANTTSGAWVSGNRAGQRLRYRNLPDRPDLESVFFREAGEPTVERDSAIWGSMGRDLAMRFALRPMGAYEAELMDVLTTGGGTVLPLPAKNSRQKREARAQVFSYMDRETALAFGLEPPPAEIIGARKHHMSEVSITGREGKRYVYGLPAYNLVQKDVEFNVDLNDGNVDLGGNYVTYSENDASTRNRKGRDHFYSSSVIPAYPYAFLLTAVLSPDYSDVDDIRGPSDGDLGNYTRFTYQSGSDAFPWRTPAKARPDETAYGVACLDRRLASSDQDDKASYTYGEKEIHYLRTIEGRNLIAVFHLNDKNTAPRRDAMGVKETGERDTQRSRYLTRIDLYKKVPGLAVDDYATQGGDPVQSVHFAYMDAAGSLCPGGENMEPGWGKLTLKKVWFTYGSSQMGATTPYQFTYHAGPGYDMSKQDRWGNYKAHTGPVPNDLFPYAEQGPDADANAAAWKMSSIRTPSGALISMAYEADDYAYVQDRPAMRMIPLTAFECVGGMEACAWRPNDLGYRDALYFKVPEDCGGMEDKDTIKAALFHGVDMLYFRAKVRLNNTQYDHVSGYAQIDDVQISNDLLTGYVKLKRVPIDGGPDDNSVKVNPICRAALEFTRLNHPRMCHPGSMEFDGDQVSKAAAYAMVQSVVGFIQGIGNFFHGPNKELWDNGLCTDGVAAESWIRVNDPDRVKKGGGYRVKSLRIKDQWDLMEPDEPTRTAEYGQDYAYGNEKGSFGVASYEPMSGADENPWRQPVYGGRSTKPLTPDDRFYQETPFGESLFPAASVGYSKVIVTDHFPDAAARMAQGTGRVEHEFYTARDFPTRASMTNVQAEPFGNQGSVDLLALLGFKRVDHMFTSQGFTVETNDMHGKPRSVAVYPEGSDQPISETIYTYARRSNGSGRLSNRATVIDPYGAIGQAEIGRQYEFVADMREYNTFASAGGWELNLESIFFLLGVLPVPMPLPTYSSQSTKFKSGVLVKKVHRFGLLTSITQIEGGSKVVTENLAYDAETGGVLITKLNNAFEDPIYKFDLPAYWHYEAMGPAYRNIGVTAKLSCNNGGKAHVPGARTLFFPGDELAMRGGSGDKRGWVDSVEDDAVYVVDGEGQPVPGNWDVKVLRSGRRNLQGQSMMSLTLLDNPLDGLSGNVYGNITQAQVKEYGGEWATECACVDLEAAPNAWRLNRKGVWRPWKERVWLTERSRSVYNGNTDIRRDGAYASFSPFYQVLNGRWDKVEGGWTTAREVMLYNARGEELENKDALGLYSSATFGHHGALAKTVARNARYQETGFDGFEEDATAMDCRDRHFSIAGGTPTDDDAHTGRHSLRVTASSPAFFTQEAWDCPGTPCALAATVSPAGSVVTITGAIGAYTIVPERLSGNVSFSLTSLGLDVSGETSAPWSANLVVTDDRGCTISTIISYPGNL